MALENCKKCGKLRVIDAEGLCGPCGGHEFNCEKCGVLVDDRYSPKGEKRLCNKCLSTVTIGQAPGIIRAAIQEANALASQRKFASAYDALANVAKRIVNWGETKSLRTCFQRPGGSWDAMGNGTQYNRLPREVWAASSALQEAVRLLPRTGDYDTYRDEE